MREKDYKSQDNRKSTEVYDHAVPNQYKDKEFSRKSKSFLRSEPNQFGDALMRQRGGF